VNGFFHSARFTGTQQIESLYIPLIAVAADIVNNQELHYLQVICIELFSTIAILGLLTPLRQFPVDGMLLKLLTPMRQGLMQKDSNRKMDLIKKYFDESQWFFLLVRIG